MYVDKGQRWRFNVLNPYLISARSLPPVWSYLTVTWVDNDNVYYRKDSNPGKVEQTPLVRFLEVAEYVEIQESKPMRGCTSAIVYYDDPLESSGKCTCLSDMALDAYSPGGPSSGQTLPPPCQIHIGGKPLVIHSNNVGPIKD